MYNKIKHLRDGTNESWNEVESEIQTFIAIGLWEPLYEGVKSTSFDIKAELRND